jgi:hypothetical protein
MRRAPDSQDGTRRVPGSGAGGGVLLLSMRRLSRLVANSITYEFEDVITQVTDADRIDAGGAERLDFSRRAYKLARYASGSREWARALSPAPSVVRLERDYDLFLPVFNDAYELYALATVPGWRKRCRVAACYVAELWPHQLPRYLLELLGDFDHVFVGVHSPVREVTRITRRPCTYLPLAADLLTFSPLLQPVDRVIDVCNLGRRSDRTHAALLRLARDRRIFYYYDTAVASGPDKKQRTFRVEDAAEHRLLLANLLRRSRYYLASRARANQPEFTRGHEEISGRYYEGAAAGTVMLGDPPDCEHFRQQFDWPDAVIGLPFDAPGIGGLLAELDRNPQHLAQVGRANACHAARRHDWLHRLRAIYDRLGLSPTAGMVAREHQLQALATAGSSRTPDRFLLRATAP